MAKAKAKAAPVQKAARTSSKARILVEAERLGYHGNVRRRPGDQFHIPADEKVATWMKVVDGGEAVVVAADEGEGDE